MKNGNVSNEEIDFHKRTKNNGKNKSKWNSASRQMEMLYIGTYLSIGEERKVQKTFQSGISPIKKWKCLKLEFSVYWIEKPKKKLWKFSRFGE